MDNGQTVAPATETPPAPKVDAPPAPPAPQTFMVPAEMSSVLQGVNQQCEQLLTKLGNMTADYEASKAQMLQELKDRRAQFKTLLEDTARRGNVPIDRERWLLNQDCTILTRAT